MKHILVALDGSDHARKALGIAADLAARYGAELIAVYVIQDKPLSPDERHLAETEFGEKALKKFESFSDAFPGGMAPFDMGKALGQYSEIVYRARREIGGKLLTNAKDFAAKKGVENVTALIEEGDPAAVILDIAKKRKADAIVLGSRGLSDIKGLMLGSVSHKVMHLAGCTCITVR